MSWGWKITILYSGFVIMILTFVIASTQQEFHLVTEDYYAEEIAYQNRIDRTKAALALSDPMAIRLVAQDGVIEIDYPDEQRTPAGEIHLYRPDNARHDQKIAIAPDADHRQRLSLQGLKPGLWKVQVTWQANGQEFYKEQVVVF